MIYLPAGGVLAVFLQIAVLISVIKGGGQGGVLKCLCILKMSLKKVRVGLFFLLLLLTQPSKRFFSTINSQTALQNCRRLVP